MALSAENRHPRQEIATHRVTLKGPSDRNMQEKYDVTAINNKVVSGPCSAERRSCLIDRSIYVLPVHVGPNPFISRGMTKKVQLAIRTSLRDPEDFPQWMQMTFAELDGRLI